MSLIPTELHAYSSADLIRGLLTSLRSSGSRQIIALPELGEGIPIISARAGIIIALKALRLPRGSRIGVPLYCCPVVFKAIVAAGCMPRFLDVDEGAFCLSPEKLRPKLAEIDALIVVHMFGVPCDMVNIKEIMDGKPIVEDCAQSLGSKLNEKACGTFGDIAVFSFRSGKYLSSGEGGALYSINADLLSRISELISALPTPLPLAEARHVVETYIRSSLRSRPLWGLIGARVWAAYNKRTDFADKSPIVLSRIFLTNLATVQRRTPHLGSMIARQKKYAEYYDRNLRLDPGMIIKQPLGYSFNRFMYPIVFPTKELRDFVARFLRSLGIDSARPYEDAVAGATQYYGYMGECPATENMLRRVLVIPSYYALKYSDIEYIARCVYNAWVAALGHRS